MYIYIYIYNRTRMSMHPHTHFHAHTHINTHTHMDIRMYVCMCTLFVLAGGTGARPEAVEVPYITAGQPSSCHPCYCCSRLAPRKCWG
jgi:hypothetical protein